MEGLHVDLLEFLHLRCHRHQPTFGSETTAFIFRVVVKMEAVSISEMLVVSVSKITRRMNPKVQYLNLHRRENLRFHKKCHWIDSCEQIRSRISVPSSKNSESSLAYEVRICHGD
jgi:hypothetical protein